MEKHLSEISLRKTSNHPVNYYYHRPAHHLTCDQLAGKITIYATMWFILGLRDIYYQLAVVIPIKYIIRPAHRVETQPLHVLNSKNVKNMKETILIPSAMLDPWLVA